MPNPNIVECPADEWTLVAVAAKGGRINRVKTTPNKYAWTYRLTGGAAPTSEAEGVPIFDDRTYLQLPSSNGIDVYVYPYDHDGSVRPDILTELADVYIQDQTSFPIEYFLTRKIQDVVLAANVAIESNYIDLVAGHGFVVGNYIEIKYDDGVSIPRLFQGEVIAVNVNQITVMPSIDFNCDTAFILSSKRTDARMNGLTASIDDPIEFDISPVDNLSYDMTAISVSMILETNPDDGLFGDQPELQYGAYFGYKEIDDLGEEQNVVHLANVRNNSDFRIYCGPQNVVYTTRSSGGGSYGFSAEKILNGQENYGVVARLSGTKQFFYVSIHDNIGVVRMRIKIRGHVVED